MAQEAKMQNEMTKRVKDKVESDSWTRITTYLADMQEKMDQKAKLHY